MTPDQTRDCARRTSDCLLVRTPPGADAEWDWILSVVLGDWLGVGYRREAVSGTACVIIAPEGADPTKCLTLGADFWLAYVAEHGDYPTPAEPLATWTPEPAALGKALVEPKVPVIFGAAHRADLPLDVFGAAFWMLARVEELSRDDFDNHGRFQSKYTLAVREDFVDRPIIDEYVALLRASLLARFPTLHLRTAEFRMQVSHDVDAPSQFGLGMTMPWVKGMVRVLRQRKSARELSIGLRRLVKTPAKIEAGDPFNTFDYLMAQSEKRGISSAFYFFGGRTDPRADAGYDLSHPAIQALLTEVHQRGHEVGLHPSYRTYLAPDILVKEAANLFEQCQRLGISQERWGGRMHFLRWRWPDTACSLNDAGLNYDSTLGFADRAGFRCGTSHEYQAFDPVRRRTMALRLRPLVVMECSVISPRYMGLGYSEKAHEAIFTLKDRCRKYGGTFTLLWHNSHFSTDSDRCLYEAALDH